MPSAVKQEKRNKKKLKKKIKKDLSKDETPQYIPKGSAFDFLATKRAPNKRRIRPAAGLHELEFVQTTGDTSSDDSDYKPKEEDNDEDVDMDEDDSEANGVQSSSAEDDDSDSSAVKIDGEGESSQDLLNFDSAADLNRKFAAKKVLICSVCCGDRSADSDEIVECDSCGISVHEGCYGIVPDDSDADSIHSNVSSDPTEPWFCDACKADNRSPVCELCPNTNGIFKQTDVGRWVHIVCCLYTHGVTFGDTLHLSGITLFELSTERWGAKVCTLCEDERVALTGITVCCDAGMCKSHFHVTCAQREGLLQEPNLEETEIVDPFYAHCKLHAGDKQLAKSKRRNWLALQSRLRARRENQPPLSERTLKKLVKAREKYRLKMESMPKPWIPTQKQPRLLTTSPIAVRKLIKKAELLGFSPQAQYIAPQDLDVRRKWHIPPAFSLEFVSYFLDRHNRMSSMAKRLDELKKQNGQLKESSDQVQKQYEEALQTFNQSKSRERESRERAQQLWTLLSELAGKPLKMPNFLIESPVKQAEHVTPSKPKNIERIRKRLNSNTHKPIVMNECGICHKTHDQHLLALCDKCGLYYHLKCLDPPLRRMPKKSRFGGWQCSECTEKEDDEPEDNEVETNDENSHDGSRRALRESRKGPDKFVPDADQATPTQPLKRKRGRPAGSQNKNKKPKKVKVAISLSGEDGTESQSLDFDQSPIVSLERLPKSALRKAIVKEEKIEKECCQCNTTSDVKGMVQCDECELYYHFGCLDPPVKKSPKARGYQWYCESCDTSSEEDSDEEDEDEEDSDEEESDDEDEDMDEDEEEDDDKAEEIKPEPEIKANGTADHHHHVKEEPSDTSEGKDETVAGDIGTESKPSTEALK